MTKENRKLYGLKYRTLRKRAGWKTFLRYVPSDLEVELLRVVAEHKAKHFELWNSLPTPSKSLKG